MAENRPVSGEVATNTQVTLYRSSPFQYASTVPSDEYVVDTGEIVVAVMPPALVQDATEVKLESPDPLKLDVGVPPLEAAGWAALYAEFAEEDAQLANVGLVHYAGILSEEEDASPAR